MRRTHSLPIALIAATMLAGSAMAQTQQPPIRQDLRQLSWPGRSMAATPSNAPAAARGDLRRPNLVIPHGGFSAVQPAPTVATLASAPRTLTPANAWMRPVSAPHPVPAPAIAAPTRADAPPAVRPAPQPTPAPEYLPVVRTSQVRSPAPSDEAEPASMDPADPMAPRRDAPIFRMQQAAPRSEPLPQGPAPEPRAETAAPAPHRVAEVTNTGERPPQQGARYYSVHRQNGRQPDALAMPEPTYVDALAITMTQTPASQDLAEPEQGPTLIRDSQGRTRPAPAASDGDHQ